MASSVPTVRIPILHANDVYRVRQKVSTPDGPKDYYADQFVSRAHAVRSQWPSAASGQADDLPGLSLFSGDVFNPSVESVITRGEHMICVLNAIKWDCACPGNHDFDGSTPLLQHLISETNFPWVFSNVVDTTGKGQLKLPAQLGDGVAQLDQTLPWWTCTTQGVKVGIVGLVEPDWISTIPSWPPEVCLTSTLLCVCVCTMRELTSAVASMSTATWSRWPLYTLRIFERSMDVSS